MNQIVPSVSIQNLLNQREAVAALVKQGIAHLREADELARAAGMGFPDVNAEFHGGRSSSMRLCGKYRENQADAFLAKFLNTVDAGAWGHLMNHSGIRTFLDAKTRQEWDSRVHGGEVPPLTFENIEATFATLYNSRDSMFEAGVIGVYRSLSWDYKTNAPFKFGKRIILERLFSCYGAGTRRYLSLSHNAPNQIDDLERVFCILDGKPEPDHRNGWYSRMSEKDAAREMAASGDYFDIKWFFKGTGHIVFKRPDLVDRMNLILAKHYPAALAYEQA